MLCSPSQIRCLSSVSSLFPASSLFFTVTVLGSFTLTYYKVTQPTISAKAPEPTISVSLSTEMTPSPFSIVGFHSLVTTNPSSIIPSITVNIRISTSFLKLYTTFFDMQSGELLLYTRSICYNPTRECIYHILDVCSSLFQGPSPSDGSSPPSESITYSTTIATQTSCLFS